MRSDDGKQAVLDICDWGGFVIRGGYQPPPARPPPAAPADPSAAVGAGRGSGRGPAPARQIVIDGLCFGIEPRDTKLVEAALTSRGLTPVADHHGKDFSVLPRKGPDGFHLQISNGNMTNRRRTPATAKMGSPVPFESTGWKDGVVRSHLVPMHEVQGVGRLYNALLGWKPGETRAARTSAKSGTCAASSSAAAAAAFGSDPADVCTRDFVTRPRLKHFSLPSEPIRYPGRDVAHRRSGMDRQLLEPSVEDVDAVDVR